MGAFEDEKIYGIKIRESANDGSDFTNPDADYRLAFLGEDGLWHVKDSSGTVTDPFAGSGAVATDAIWDAAGDLAVGTGANTAARVAIGAAETFLKSNGTTAAWTAPVVPWSISPEGGAAAGVPRSIGTSNRAIYAPCIVPTALTLTGVRIVVAVQSGNISVGLYDSGGSRVATSGAVGCPASGPANVSFTGNYSAVAGRYYLAFSCDNTTATFLFQDASSGATGAALAKFQATAHPIPTTMTPGAGTVSPLSFLGLVSGGFP